MSKILKYQHFTISNMRSIYRSGYKILYTQYNLIDKQITNFYTYYGRDSAGIFIVKFYNNSAIYSCYSLLLHSHTYSSNCILQIIHFVLHITDSAFSKKKKETLGLKMAGHLQIIILIIVGNLLLRQ